VRSVFTLAVLAGVLATAGACGSGDGDSRPLREVLAAPDDMSFDIRFRVSGSSSSDQVFVWRQSEGVRRFDVLIGTPPMSGALELQTVFRQTNVASEYHDCSWLQAARLDRATVECDEPLEVSGDIVYLVTAMITYGELEDATRDEVIAGRDARCYSVRKSELSRGMEVCLARDSALPLRMQFETTTVSAIDIREQSGRVTEPSRFEAMASGDGEYSLVSLELP
jgi:hypothetical protein